MKLASLRTKTSRDGELCLVNRDLTRALSLKTKVDSLQKALENWDKLSPELEKLYLELNQKELSEAFLFRAEEFCSPLPRAYQWADGSAYVNHVKLVREARGAEMPENFWTIPLIYQGGSDSFLGPKDPILVADENYGIDFEAEVAIITDDVPQGVSKKEAKKHIILVMLVNDVSLRNLIPEEIARGFGFFHSKPSSAFSPIALTSNELGNSWDGEKLSLPLYSYVNGKLFGKPNAGVDMTFSFTDLIVHAAKTRPLAAGTIIGSGTVSNKDRSQGSSCIAEKRMLEIIETGKAKTSFLLFGDTIRIEMLDNEGKSLFGAIEQQIVNYKG